MDKDINEIIKDLVALFATLTQNPSYTRQLYETIGHLRRIDNEHTDQITEIIMMIEANQEKHLEMVDDFNRLKAEAEKLEKNYEKLLNDDNAIYIDVSDDKVMN